MKRKIGLAKYFLNLPEDAMLRLKMYMHYVQKCEMEKLLQLDEQDIRYKFIEERMEIRLKQLDILNQTFIKRFCNSEEQQKKSTKKTKTT